jgi:hypothetical protein
MRCKLVLLETKKRFILAILLANSFYKYKIKPFEKMLWISKKRSMLH